MNTTTRTVTTAVGLLGALLLAAPVASQAQGRSWEQGQDLLEEHLPPGKTHTYYRAMLTDLGYLITSVNYNEPDYVEYEVVKGDRTYEIQIDMDEDTTTPTTCSSSCATITSATGTGWRSERRCRS